MIVGTFWPWRTVALFYTLLPLTSFIIILFIPETPYWLISKSRSEEAQKSLAWFRGVLVIKMPGKIIYKTGFRLE